MARDVDVSVVHDRPAVQPWLGMDSKAIKLHLVLGAQTTGWRR